MESNLSLSRMGKLKKLRIQEARNLFIQRGMQSFVHACQCRDKNCPLASCERIKRFVYHTKTCKTKVDGNCPLCKILLEFSIYHAEHCTDAKCAIPICLSIKQKIKMQQTLGSLQNLQINSSTMMEIDD